MPPHPFHHQNNKFPCRWPSDSYIRIYMYPTLRSGQLASSIYIYSHVSFSIIYHPIPLPFSRSSNAIYIYKDLGILTSGSTARLTVIWSSENKNMTNTVRPVVVEEILHPRDWSEVTIREEIGGPYAEHASNPDFCLWLKEILAEAIEQSLSDGHGHRPVHLRVGRKRIGRAGITTDEDTRPYSSPR